MPNFIWFSYIFWQFLLKILFFLLLDCSLDVTSCFVVDFRIYVETAWFEKLKTADVSKSGHMVASFLNQCMQRVFIYDCAKCYYIGARNKGFGMGDPLATYGTKSPAFQPVSATRIYVLHKITIELKFMSCINSDLPIPEKKLQTPD